RKLTNYDANTNTASILTGDATARSIASKVKSIITGSVSTGGALSTLSEIGVAFKADGTLALDSAKLKDKISTNFEDIAKLFAVSATASDSQVSYVMGSSKTQAGTYAINISQLGSESTDTVGSINGVAATGSRTSLKGAVGNASEGLIIRVDGGALGDRGTITYSIGFAAQLNNLITDYLDEEGMLSSKTEALNSSVTRLDKETERQEARLVLIEKRYRAQFTALEVMLSNMSSTSNYLSQQLAQLAANR
ncbi:MAG: flagellar filament capping protein FliD, partial [Nitrosomonadales bacterium]|nr:flagellar filament capping protein FliD [Nitrosomonadales bacterium]